MTTDNYVSLFAGFVGAIIGAASSIITVLLQLRSQDRRERVRQAAQLAMEEFKVQLDLAKKKGKGEGVLPVSVWCHYYAEVLAALERGDLSVETMRGILDRNAELVRLTEHVTKLRGEEMKKRATPA